MPASIRVFEEDSWEEISFRAFKVASLAWRVPVCIILISMGPTSEATVAFASFARTSSERYSIMESCISGVPISIRKNKIKRKEFKKCYCK